jgi:hypothetical protein
MSALEDVVAAAEPALAAYAVPGPAPGREGSDGLSPGRAFVLEAVREGYEMHYGEPRAYAGMDPDLRLLAGDALYALGLSRLAEDGDLEAVRELADLISACARAEVEDRSADVQALWERTSERLAAPAGKLAPER